MFNFCVYLMEVEVVNLIQRVMYLVSVLICNKSLTAAFICLSFLSSKAFLPFLLKEHTKYKVALIKLTVEPMFCTERPNC